MKIFAGFILYGMKPRQAPKSAQRMMTMLTSLTMSAITIKDAVEMADTPTASPSRPSMKLTAFVMATIQMIVTGMDSQPRFRYVASEKTFGFEMNWILQPCQTATPAAAICTNSFGSALSAMISSSTPRITIMIAPSRMPCICRSIFAKTSTESKNARKMARPPIRGIGTLCMRRLSFGTSIAPTLHASVLTSGVAANETAAATSIASSI